MGRGRFRRRKGKAKTRETRSMPVFDEEQRAKVVITTTDGGVIEIHPQRMTLTADPQYEDVTRWKNTNKEYVYHGKRFVLTMWE